MELEKVLRLNSPAVGLFLSASVERPLGPERVCTEADTVLVCWEHTGLF